jgi:hypothetical protein
VRGHALPRPGTGRRRGVSEIGWFKNDDSLHAHRKTRKAGLEAMGLWVVAGTWSSSQNTEGFVPGWFVDTWPRGRALAKKLVGAGFWDVDADGGEDGWRFHDWLDYNFSQEEVDEKRKAAAERQRKHRRAKNGRYVTGVVTRDVMRDNTRYVTRESHHPDPARPDPTPRTTLGGDLTGVDAGERPPLYSGRCSRHGDVAEPGPCGGCADARKAGRPTLALVLPEQSSRCLVHAIVHDGICSGCAADEKAAN